MWRRNRNMETYLGRIQDVKRRRRRELAGGMWKDSGRGRGGELWMREVEGERDRGEGWVSKW